jgi:hypothetical protein
MSVAHNLGRKNGRKNSINFLDIHSFTYIYARVIIADQFPFAHILELNQLNEDGKILPNQSKSHKFVRSLLCNITSPNVH